LIPWEKKRFSQRRVGLKASWVMNIVAGGACPYPKSLISMMLNSLNGNGPRNCW
jgi:hypothetical protein